MSTQGSKRLKIVNDQPSVEKLWNGRFRLEFFCFNEGKKKDWYGDNIDRILPAFGIKMGDKFGEGEWSLPDGAEYADMTLVEAGLQFIPAAGTHYVKMVYETLTASWVEEKDEDTDYELSGLKRVSRTFVALPGTVYDKVVGTSTIDSGGTTLYLGSFKIDKTEAKWELTEVWLEAGVLSLSQEFVGGATTVQVGAFGMTEAQVDTALSEVTVSHILIGQSEKDYNGIITSQFTYEVDDFEVESQAEDGMEIIVQTELSATNFTSGVIGTSTYKTLFLTHESIDNGNTIKKRTGRYSEAGVLSISPLEEDGFSLAPSYVYVTTGAPASSMTGLRKPNGTALGSDVTWFEPKVQNVEGFSTYTQQVLAITLIATVKVHSVDKFFTITEPGVMSTGGSFNSNAKSGAATRYPKALSQPSTYRKKATVDVYLTSVSSIAETEVAFTEEGVDWCSIGFDSFYTNDTESTASVSSSWRSFPQYLNSSGTTDSAVATRLGVYAAYANSYGAGDTAYTTAGIYRVELEKYTRAADGTQLYLKTIVTF
jgi:hypothetical protein